MRFWVGIFILTTFGARPLINLCFALDQPADGQACDGDDDDNESDD